MGIPIHTHIALLVALLVPSAALAQSASQPDQPWRVARVSVIEGAASAKAADDTDWSAAQLNQPLFAGDSFYTGAGTRAEIQLEDEIFLYLDENTLIEIPFLEDRFGRISITQGSVVVHAKPIGTIARPPLEVLSSYFLSTIDEPAKARFDVQPSGESEINVLTGTIRINRDQDRFYTVQRGERMVVTTPDPDTYTLLPIGREDAFDRWTEVRTATHAASQQSGSYVTNRVAGYRDLDHYGNWVETKDYGHVWRPTVVTSSWAPYRDGHWEWREPAGWVWVSYEPWGWVPYHYGRWVYTSSYRWVWVPKTVYVYDRPTAVYIHRRPLWYPALVSFTHFDYGSSFSVSVGYGTGGYVGWFPLGYRDPYCWHFGSYGHRYHRHYGDNIIVNNGTIIINDNDHIYENIDVDNSVTVMPTRDLATGRYDRKAALSLNATSAPRNAAVGSEAISRVPNPQNPRSLTDGVTQSSRGTEPLRTVSTRPERVQSPQATPAGIQASPVRVASAEQVGRRSSVAQARTTSAARVSPDSGSERVSRSSVSAQRTSSPSRSAVRPSSAQRSSLAGPSRTTASEPTTASSRLRSPARGIEHSPVTERSSYSAQPRTERRTSAGRSLRPETPTTANRAPASRTLSPQRSSSQSSPGVSPNIRSRSAYEPTRSRSVVPTSEFRSRLGTPTGTSRARVERSAVPRSSAPRSAAQQLREYTPPRTAPQSRAQQLRSSSSTQRYTVPPTERRSTRSSGVYTTPRQYQSPNSIYSSPPRSSSVERSPARSSNTRTFTTSPQRSRIKVPQNRYQSAPRSSGSIRTPQTRSISPSRSTQLRSPSQSISPSRSTQLRSPSRSISPSRSTQLRSPSRSISPSRSTQSIQRSSAPRTSPARAVSPGRSASTTSKPRG